MRPSDEHRSFIKAWEKLEKSIGGSEGNIALSLSKPAGDNLVFVSYRWAAWHPGMRVALRAVSEGCGGQAVLRRLLPPQA
jgi:hypothetical protein